jgi:hypothetical protein
MTIGGGDEYCVRDCPRVSYQLWRTRRSTYMLGPSNVSKNPVGWPRAQSGLQLIASARRRGSEIAVMDSGL